MSDSRPASVSLLWRILLSTSVAITVLFAAVGWILQEQFVRLASSTLEDEAHATAKAYEALWRARADRLASTSLVLSRMPDVRGAFSTGDRATIRDTALEVWDQLSRPGALFLVCDPRGSVIASVGAVITAPESASLSFVRAASGQFPRQAQGFVALDGKLYQTVVTPVYVAATQAEALLNVLVAGIAVDSELVSQLKAVGGDHEFVFLAGNHVAASTLPPEMAESISRQDPKAARLDVGGVEYSQFTSQLTDLEGAPTGELRLLRSFAAANARIAALRTRLAILWVAAMLAGLVVTFLLTKRLLKPVQALDSAAAEIAKGNYDVRLDVPSRDEIGRLAETFNGMCLSINNAREDLIRQERISTIGRLATSIVHDLRNPLAAIYGGAEMLVDSDLSQQQVRRLSANIYRASRQIQDLLKELSDLTQGRKQGREQCRLREIVQAAYEPLAASAEARHVRVTIDVPDDFELPLDRSPMERVFQNLIGNAIEAMPHGGSVAVQAGRGENEILVTVEDDGPGIPSHIADELFQPFVTAGKKNGMGLGLALSRKTVLSHGGDLWAETSVRGARFQLRLPVKP